MLREGDPKFVPEESHLDLPVVNWSQAAEGMRLGDYEPANWVYDFKELPELADIPEPANPRDVLLVHYTGNMTQFLKNVGQLTRLPPKGEICAALYTKNNPTGGPIGLILEPDRGAIREMHVIDINSSVGWPDLPRGVRKAANPRDRVILRQLQSLGRLTPEQVATIQIGNEPNEVLVESSKIRRVLGIIWNEDAMKQPESEIIWQAREQGIPLFKFNLKDRIVEKVAEQE